MDDQTYHYGWDEDTYRTGQTKPPKRRGGWIALGLILVIFLLGIVSALGMLNAFIFQKAADAETESASLSFSQIPSKHQDGAAPTQAAGTDHLDLADTPTAQENIPQEGGLSLQAIYEKNIDSVVSIGCILENGTSSGTGVVLSQDGYLVTNHHVVAEAQKISVSFSDGRQLAAHAVGMDETSDQAVLWVDAEDLTPAEFGDSDSVRVGDLAVAIGDPLGVELRGTMTDGIISAINRDLTTGGRTMTLLQTNAALNSGNSGGPLINCYGQVIGINTMKIGDYMNVAGVEGLGFAIPSATVKEIVDQLISQGYVTGRPDLGISGQDISPIYQHLYGLPQGVYITYVDPASDAYAQGIRSGDMLIALDEKSVTNTQELQTLLYQYQAGDVVNTVIYRSGRSYQLQLRLSQAGAQ